MEQILSLSCFPFSPSVWGGRSQILVRSINLISARPLIATLSSIHLPLRRSFCLLIKARRLSMFVVVRECTSCRESLVPRGPLFFNGPEFHLDSSACGAFFELSIPICPGSPRAVVPLQVATRLVAAFRPSNIANSPLFALRIVRAPRPGTLAAVYEDWARPALVPSSPARSRTILVQSINRSPLAWYLTTRPIDSNSFFLEKVDR